jgi:hypothetical protein
LMVVGMGVGVGFQKRSFAGSRRNSKNACFRAVRCERFLPENGHAFAFGWLLRVGRLGFFRAFIQVSSVSTCRFTPAIRRIRGSRRSAERRARKLAGSAFSVMKVGFIRAWR